MVMPRRRGGGGGGGRRRRRFHASWRGAWEVAAYWDSARIKLPWIYNGRIGVFISRYCKFLQISRFLPTVEEPLEESCNALLYSMPVAIRNLALLISFFSLSLLLLRF